MKVSQERKECVKMASENEIINHQKAAMYDLINILEKQGKETYTLSEIKSAIDAYFTGKNA